jgi:crotonobetainyl-CoA:carnitine CoA-transferase CaiB-like acyl-CoA transferase
MDEDRTQPAAMLSPYRVLDLTDERGEIAAMVLGDLGADVIKIEPRGGSSARARGPLLAGGAEAERSLQFLAYNRNKRSIVLDLENVADRDTLLRLVADADIVFESAPDSDLAEHGIGFEQLRAANPRIVHVQISAFGMDGPAASWPGSDLTIAALGGPVAVQGVPDRAPVRLSVPQVWRHAGVEAAVAALVGHARMRQTDDAQLVDVSAQCAMTWTLLNAMDAAAIQGHDFQRMGSLLQLGQLTLPIVFECADGYVVGIPTGGMMAGIVHWMVEEGIVDASWAREEWVGYETRLLAGEPLAHGPEEVLAALTRLFRDRSKNDLFERGLSLGATFAPVNTVADVLEFRHLDERNFWRETALANGHTVRAPGVFAHASATPLSVRRSAPSLDQHGAEIRRELAERPRVASAAPPSPSGRALPFEGLKVADFSWIGVGPISGRYLADHGATVVRVESELRPDNLRGAAPYKDGKPGWNRSHFFSEFNASKLGLLLNLKEPAAIEIARRLLAWADVYIESFTPGTVDQFGLGYAVARELNPSIVMASTCLMGQSGPAAKMAGYGYHAGAVAGFYEVTSWPDLPPDGPWVAYTDTIAPRFLAATLMAAIDHRRRTGEGQHIDAAQFEMGLQFLAPEILDYQTSGHLVSRMGNRARDAAPQGVYPCAGDDQWCAIAVETDAHWMALRHALGDPEWARDPELDGTAGRLKQHDRIDEQIGSWTRALEPHAASELLRAAGVPAGAVQRSSDLLRDAQYAHREFYRYLDHAEMGRIPYAGHQFRIRGYPSGARSPGPVLGEHSFEVLRELLGMGDEEIAAAFAGGAIA